MEGGDGWRVAATGDHGEWARVLPEVAERAAERAADPAKVPPNARTPYLRRWSDRCLDPALQAMSWT